ncbi:GDP-mannose-dependent alpha-(1-2)-phosphatidylinositol mannosyltransferase [compost metagenome]
MKILFLTAAFPYPPHDGERVRTYHLLRILGKRFDVHVLTFFRDPTELAGLAALQQLGVTIHVVPQPRFSALSALKSLVARTPFFVQRYASKTFKRQLQALLNAHQFDAIHVDGLPVAQYLKDLGPGRQQVVLDIRDAWSLLYARQLQQARPGWPRWARWLKWKGVQRYERWALREGARCVLLSDADKLALSSQEPRARDITLVPNGVDVDFFASDYAEDVRPAIVFTGAMGYGPNAEAVEFLIEQVLPLIHARRPDVRLMVVGRDPSPRLLSHRSPLLEVTGQVEDIRPYLGKATVVVCPLLTGAGIKNKVLEAMAAGKAIVATPIAMEGIPATDGAQVLVRAEPEAIASAVLELLASPELRQAMGREAQRFVRSHFSWDAAADKLEVLYGHR